MQGVEFGGGRDLGGSRQVRLEHLGVDPGVGLVGRRCAESAEGLHVTERQAQTQFFIKLSQQRGVRTFTGFELATWQDQRLSAALAHQQQAPGTVAQADGSDVQGGASDQP